MSNYTRGRHLERRVAGVLEGAGYLVTLMPQSRGPADIWAARAGKVWGDSDLPGITRLLLVSVKIPTGPLPPRERESLLRAAEVTGGIPLHVHPVGRELLWRRLTGQAHDAWEKWLP